MNIEQYVFSQSYLKNAAFDLQSGDLILEIEAYISMEHPGLNGIFDDGEDCDFELFYRMIEMRFVNVQYLETIRTGPDGSSGPSVQGCIEGLEIVDAVSLDRGINYDPGSSQLELILQSCPRPTVRFSRSCEPLEIALFRSSALAFLVGYDGLEISEVED